MSAESDATSARRAQRATGPADPRARESAGGYHLAVEDGGPNYGLSLTVNGLTRNGSDVVVDFTIANSYIRHTSVFAGFLNADRVTPMTVDDENWLAMLVDSPCWPLVSACLRYFPPSKKPEWLGSDKVKFLGKLGAESTFLGIPVTSANVDFRFILPQKQGPVGKIRVLVGSLGVSSGNEWDPIAAWVGLSLTVLIDLAIPLYALLLSAGVQTNAVFDKMFKDVNLMLPIATAVYTSVKDLFTDPSKVGKDIASLALTLGNALIKSVLTRPDVLAALGAYFGAEEAEGPSPSWAGASSWFP